MALVCSSCFKILSKRLISRQSLGGAGRLVTVVASLQNRNSYREYHYHKKLELFNKSFHQLNNKSRQLLTGVCLFSNNNSNGSSNECSVEEDEKDKKKDKTEIKQTTEDELTDEEVKVLKEIEEEEERVRELLENNNSMSQDYSIWEDDRSLTTKTLAGSLSEGHRAFKDQSRIIQDQIEEMWNPTTTTTNTLDDEEEEEEILPIIYPRGKTGVFDLGELVELLKEEHGDEILAITIPKELDYADYMLIVTVRNNKHLMALATFVRKRFKMKERKRSDILPHLEKRRDHKGWIALDLGNIILHLFLQDVRDYYDLETLWTVGPMYDDLSNVKDSDIVQLLNSLSSLPVGESLVTKAIIQKAAQFKITGSGPHDASHIMT